MLRAIRNPVRARNPPPSFFRPSRYFPTKQETAQATRVPNRIGTVTYLQKQQDDIHFFRRFALVFFAPCAPVFSTNR